MQTPNLLNRYQSVTETPPAQGGLNLFHAFNKIVSITAECDEANRT